MNDQLNELLEILKDKQELHPDLKACLNDRGDFLLIQHPLCHAFYTPGFERMLNDTYAYKRAAVAEAEHEGRYGFIVDCLIEKPHRLNALLDYADKMPDGVYWETVGRVWSAMEFFYDDMDVWDEVFTSGRSERYNMMDHDEQKELLALPRMIEVYRGGSPDGWSWTLDKTVAMWFANRFKKGWPVHTRKIPKDQVIALLNHRNEYEIIWRPTK